MNNKLFDGSRAWFSSSVSEQLKKKWKDYGGLIVETFQDVDYIFSSNAASDDTRRAFQAIRGTDLLVFRPKWISYALKVSNNNQLTPLGIERFILFPHFVDKDILEGDNGERDEDWNEFEADLVSSSSPRKVSPTDNPTCGKPIIHSTLIETPTKIRKLNRKSFRNNLLPETSNAVNSERRKPKIRYDCLTTPRSALNSCVKAKQNIGGVGETAGQGAIPCNDVNSDTVVGVLGEKMKQLHHGPNESAAVDFSIERTPHAQKITRRLKTTHSSKNATTDMPHGCMDEITCYDVISQSSQSSLADLNGSFRALSTSQKTENESSQPESPPLCLADIMCAKHHKTVAQSNAYRKGTRNEGNKENEEMEIDTGPCVVGTPCGNNVIQKETNVMTKVDSEKKGVLLPRPRINTSPLRSEKKRKATRSTKKSSNEFQTPSDIGTPSTVRKKRKLYRKASDSYLDNTDLISESSRRRSAEEHLSPVDIHELLNCDEKEVYLCGQKIAAASCRDNDDGTPSRSQSLKSCEDIMLRHKATIELKKASCKQTEKKKQKGLNTGFLHLDSLDIPDIMLEDFVINKAGCRVELVKR